MWAEGILIFKATKKRCDFYKMLGPIVTLATLYYPQNRSSSWHKYFETARAEVLFWYFLSLKTRIKVKNSRAAKKDKMIQQKWD